jgi:hypothetical protein
MIHRRAEGLTATYTKARRFTCRACAPTIHVRFESVLDAVGARGRRQTPTDTISRTRAVARWRPTCRTRRAAALDVSFVAISEAVRASRWHTRIQQRCCAVISRLARALATLCSGDSAAARVKYEKHCHGEDCRKRTAHHGSVLVCTMHHPRRNVTFGTRRHRMNCRGILSEVVRNGVRSGSW